MDSDWETKLEKEIMREQGIPSWYNYIFSLLYLNNPHMLSRITRDTKAKSRKNPSGKSRAICFEPPISLETILRQGKLSADTRANIHEKA